MPSQPAQLTSDQAASMLQIRYDTPDSPLTAAESIDEWALSSLTEAASDDETAPHFIMPSNQQLEILGSRSREVGKLRSVIIGAPHTGKSQLHKSLHRVPPLKHQQQVYLGHGISAVNFRAFCPDQTISFVDGADPEYLHQKVRETAGLINGVHPSAIQILAQARSLEAFPLCDCVIYCFASRPQESDIATIKQVVQYCPIIPVITMCDQLSSVDLFELRVEIRRRLENEQIPVHYFDGQSLPYTISTLTCRNWDMTASQVEFSGYASQILVESQLETLVEQLLGSSRTLRENAAHLFAEYATQNAITSSLHGFPGFPQQKYYRLNLPNALVSTKGAVVVTTQAGSSSSDRPKMSPICNLDPLDIGKWVQTIGFLSAIALTIAGATVFSPTESPAPCSDLH